MKTFYTRLIIIVLISFLSFAVTGCEDRYKIQKEIPKIEVTEQITSEPMESRKVLHLTSSYPWYASASDGWIKMTKYRGQARKRDSVVFYCEKNPDLENREGWIDIKLMDQMTKRVKVIQQGQGIFINLPQNLIYFNNQKSEITLKVLTKLDWEPETPNKDGFTFTKVDSGHIKVSAPINDTGRDRVVEIKLVDKNKTTDATLKIIQKAVEKILIIPMNKEAKDIIIDNKESEIEIPLTLNFDYEVETSEPWLNVSSAPVFEGKNVINTKVLLNIPVNNDGMERDGMIVIKNKGAKLEASDTIYVSQRWAKRIIYVKPGGTGDGTSWELAVGDIHTAMGKANQNAMEEIRVASGEYQFSTTLIWKAVNVYGGFKGDEKKFKDRDLTVKPVFKGGNFEFMDAWNNNGDICWMDGIVFADCDNYNSTSTGCFQIYMNHGFRNCEFRNIRHGRAIIFMEKCKIVNTLFHHLDSKNHLVRGQNCEFYNTTIAESVSGGWNTNYFRDNTKLYNTLIWKIKRSGGAGYRAVVIGGQVQVYNCALQSGTNEKGLVCTDCFNLGENNDADNGPKFNNPETFDYSLKAGSNCIDKGNSRYVQSKTDLLGRPRISGSSVDIGAIETIAE